MATMKSAMFLCGALLMIGSMIFIAMAQSSCESFKKMGLACDADQISRDGGLLIGVGIFVCVCMVYASTNRQKKRRTVPVKH